ncbi:MAG: Na+/H+ antiporter subunit E [Desulforhopalus sp.]
MTLIKLKIKWSTLGLQGVSFSLIWWVLTDGVTSSWWIGAPAVLLAIAAGTVLQSPASFILHELLRFVPFFLLRSLLGGADVAWRAFHPTMPIAPGLVEYQLRLPPGLPQVFMANTVSLLPGTLSAGLNLNLLKVHVLDNRSNFLAELEAVEQRVARVFGMSLGHSEGSK